MLLYPTKNAVTFDEFFSCVSHQNDTKDGMQPFTVLVLDATWNFAAEMYHRSEWLRSLPSVNLSREDFNQSSLCGTVCDGFGIFKAVRRPPTKKGEPESEMNISTAEAVSQLIEAIARVST